MVAWVDGEALGASEMKSGEGFELIRRGGVKQTLGAGLNRRGFGADLSGGEREVHGARGRAAAGGGASTQRRGQRRAQSAMQQRAAHDRVREEWLPWARPGLNSTFSKYLKYFNSFKFAMVQSTSSRG
jgi:hypothetical protein